MKPQVPESTTKGQLDLEVGDYIIWKDEEISFKDDSGNQVHFVAPGMIGKVIKESDNPLAEQLREAGVRINAGPWALVEFENGAKLMVRDGMHFEKVREQ
ncbi:hypothetical protein MYX82_02210 [Acidobacteria bacterium AH-259-D05]|nr:hypothetical protein [Acidobacteria bacterium AH-259-D05]